MSPLTEREKWMLLRLARGALQELLLSLPGSSLAKIPEPLHQRTGCFVTLRRAGTLRGCIGRIHNTVPLYQAARDCAVAAARTDPRFPPVQADELSDVHIEISVLSPLAEVTPEQIEAGRHGLLVSQGSRRGLLLPQVAVEWNWDRVRFLQETCLKARLPRDAWLSGARVEAFTAQVFGEDLEWTPSPDASHHPLPQGGEGYKSN